MKIDATRLRNIRKNLQLSQQDMADRLSITRELINKMETGKNGISPRTFFRLQEEFGDRLPQLILPPAPKNQEVKEPYSQYGHPPLNTGWQGIPVYNHPLNAVFAAAFDDNRLPPPAFLLPDPAFADCQFAAQFRGESLLHEVRNGDYILCQHINDLSFLDSGVIYFIITGNGQEVCKYLYPHAGDDADLFMLVSTLKDVPATPIKRQMIARIFRIKGVVRSY